MDVQVIDREVPMLFLHADFWPLFWGVIGGGAGLTGLLTLFVAGPGQSHRQQTPRPAEATPHRHDEAAAPHATPAAASSASPARAA
jgi:hypothetical protein